MGEEESVKGHTLLAQDLIPLQTIDGSLLRRKGDEATLTFIYIDGINDSLYTYDQKLEESAANTHMLTAINHPASIIKIPRPIDSNMQLVHIDNEIVELRREIREAGRTFGDTHPKVIRLRILQERLRPRAEEEALLGDRVLHPTYLCMEFDAKTSDKIAMQDTRIVLERLKETDRSAHICDFNEIVELLQLFFTPKNVNPDATRGNVPVTTRRKEM